jgi:hypothetical protein
MIHVPHAGEAFDGEGWVVDSTGDHDPEAQARWDGYADRTFAQLEWWADATGGPTVQSLTPWWRRPRW